MVIRSLGMLSPNKGAWLGFDRKVSGPGRMHAGIARDGSAHKELGDDRNILYGRVGGGGSLIKI